MSRFDTFFQTLGNTLDDWFLAPPFLWLLGLIPVVILLYLLKLRRTEVIIASTLLWLKSLQDLTANAPFQRLRRNLLLLLQILVILLVAAALARPFFRQEGTAGRNLCLLIDRSASMSSREGDTTRLELAKQCALEMIREMEKGDKVMLVTFAENSDVLCELTDDRPRLRAAVEGIEPSDTRTRLRDAILVARSLKLSVADLHVVVIGDGKIRDLPEIGTRAFDLTYLQIGETSANAGIVAFSMRDPLEGQDDEQQQTFALVHNASSDPLDTTLTLSFEDTVLAVEEVHVPPGDDSELVFRHPELGRGILRAELDVDDALAVDNSALLAVQPIARIKVLLVAEPDGTSSYFLQRVLVPDPRVELSTLAPTDYTESSEYDLTIFDSFAPASLPTGTLLYINAVPPMDGVGVEGTVEHPAIISVDSEHPMMRFNLNPSNVGIREALRLVVPPDTRSLVSTVGSPLVADVSRGGQQILIIGFDIAASDWPLHLSYPLFFQNLLAWVPRVALASEASTIAGQSFAIMPDPERTSVSVTRPDSSVDAVDLDPLRPVFYANTEQTGVYAVAYGDAVLFHAVNLLDRTESAVAPAESLSIGRAEIAPERGRVRQNRELWRWLVVAALAILTLEWTIYCRRAWI
ncbi:MAG: BatA and WFA domain-containing protein [Candidatus Hydrogenedentes bacterium]|nr:BatA and WFA domain-containing protein [Candidatus Hydrogenedentota bacterium]